MSEEKADVMERYLNRNIKEVIAQFPAVEEVLAEYGIGCATCEVGTCLLREIIEVHGLSEEQEREAMRRMAAAIFPGREVAVLHLTRRTAAPQRKPGGFSPPVKALNEEHVLIKRLLALVPWIVSELGAEKGTGNRGGAYRVTSAPPLPAKPCVHIRNVTLNRIAELITYSYDPVHGGACSVRGGWAACASGQE